MNLHWVKTLVGGVGLSVVLTLAGCGGTGSATNYTPVLKSVTPGDGQVTLTWDNVAGMSYWVWWIQSPIPVTIGANGNSIGASVPAESPYVMSSLTNGLPYSFALNAHANGPNSPGGPQSNPLLATPRLAGASWTDCTASGNTCPATSGNLYGVAFGNDGGILASDLGDVRNYLAVGDGGQMFLSADGQTWSAVPPQASCTPSGGGALRTAGFVWGVYFAAGDNGTVCFSGLNVYSANGIALNYTIAPLTANWYKALTLPATISNINFYGTGNNQYSSMVPISWAATGGSQVLVGSSGTVLWTGDGENWFAPMASTLPTQDLYGVGYNFCGIPYWAWVAVGANGTIAATSDATGSTSWTTVGIHKPANLTQTLRGVACTNNSTPAPLPYSQGLITYIPLWVIAGDQGVLLTSIDGVNWTTPTNFTIDGVAVSNFPVNIRQVNFGTQFVAAGDSGRVFTSYDGAHWTSQSPALGGGNIYGMAHPMSSVIPNGYLGSIPYRYVVVGTGGLSAYGQ